MVDLHMLGVFYSTWRRTMVNSGVCDAGAPGRWQIAAAPGAMALVEQCPASSIVLRRPSLDGECFWRLTGVGPCRTVTCHRQVTAHHGLFLPANFMTAMNT